MKIFVTPRQGFSIPNPETGKDLPPEGMEVESTTYWRRLIKDGDVVIAAKPTRKSSNKE